MIFFSVGFLQIFIHCSFLFPEEEVISSQNKHHCSCNTETGSDYRSWVPAASVGKCVWDHCPSPSCKHRPSIPCFDFPASSTIKFPVPQLPL